MWSELVSDRESFFDQFDEAFVDLSLRQVARSVHPVCRKLLTPATIARIEIDFHLPEDRTEVTSDLHYQSTETPNGLVTEAPA